MKYRQHVPGFVDAEPNEFEFANKDELLNRENIARWTSDENFYRFSVAPHSEDQIVLMLEENEGTTWWVLGFISGTPEEIKHFGLPNWVPNKNDHLKLVIKNKGDTKTVEFRNRNELMGLEEMKLCPHLPGFHRFAINDANELVVEHDKGNASWVLGVFSGKQEIIDGLGLPKVVKK